ncbi:hypothetical protein JYT10_00025 [Beggiatoa alba]|nr:hypothetical protein [bacterium AH-315-E07]MBN4081879.1 hypothetical protein [Beggiatoa alba]
MFKAQGAARLSAPDTGESECRSPGLQLIFERINSGGKVNILDLGSPLSRNVDFLSSYFCRLYIADWLQSLPLDGAHWGGHAAFSPLFSEMLPLQSTDKFDVILGWDIINYLSVENIKSFSRFLAKHTNPKALCFFSLATRKEMPAQPAKYHIVAEDTLHYEQLGYESCQSPRFSQSRLLEMMPEFLPQRSFLLQNGRQEQVLRIR